MKRWIARQMWRFWIGVAMALSGLLLAPWASLAADYPVKPITVIVAYAAGGGTDVPARLLNQYAEKQLKQPLVVVNKTGAGGEIGFSELARSRADGYTIGWLNTPNAIGIAIQRKAAYSLEDFTPICNVISDPGVLAVRADSPLDTVEKVLDEARKKKGAAALTYGTTGIGSDDHLAMLMLERETGTKFNHIVFDGAAQGTVALLGGHITLFVANESEVVPQVRAGKMKVIAVMNEKRLASLPNVPTLPEKGIKVLSSSARGLVAPKGTPAAILGKLEGAFLKAKDDPEFQKKAKDLALPLLFQDAKGYAEFLKGQNAFYRALWEKSPWM